MSGRRLAPPPAGNAPVTELIDPALATPQPMPYTGPMGGDMPPELQAALAAAAADPNGGVPFATFGEEPEPSVSPPTEEGEELTPAERLEFSSLMLVGRRSKIIEVFGHKVHIESLTVADDLRIGLYCKEFQGAPPAEQRSYQLAVCACSIRTVDTRPLYVPLVENTTNDEIFTEKVQKLKDWYPAVVTEVYREVLGLDREFAELAEKLKKSKGSASATS